VKSILTFAARFFDQRRSQSIIVERQLGDLFSESPIFVLQVSKALFWHCAYAGDLIPPAIKRLWRQTVSLTRVFDGISGVDVAEDSDQFINGKTCDSHNGPTLFCLPPMAAQQSHAPEGRAIERVYCF
jgi:hypothetical protein